MPIDIGAGAKISKGDVGLANVDNTADADKPISVAVAGAIDGIPIAEETLRRIRINALVGEDILPL
jgi:hypothetical protein